MRFLHLTQEDGLSQNAGLAFLQDSRGFMWIGTQDGLNRYDGQTLEGGTRLHRETRVAPTAVTLSRLTQA